MTAIAVLSTLSAIAATVLAFIFIVPESKAKKLNSFGKLIHNIANFKFLIIEKVMQALYIFCTVLVVCAGFFMLFYVEPGYSGRYYSSSPTWYGGYGLLTIVLGPIAVRLVYEVFMMFILLVKNVIQINNKMANTSGEDTKDIFAEQIIPQPTAAPQYEFQAPEAAQYAAPQPAATVCPVCGMPIGDEAFCATCGTKLK